MEKKRPKKKKIQETRRPIYGDAHLDFATYRIALLRKKYSLRGGTFNGSSFTLVFN